MPHLRLKITVSISVSEQSLQALGTETKKEVKTRGLGRGHSLDEECLYTYEDSLADEVPGEARVERIWNLQT